MENFLGGLHPGIGVNFQGNLTAFGIWEKSLSQEEIFELMANTPPKDMPGLLGFWKLRDRVGNLFWDSGPSAFHALAGQISYSTNANLPFATANTEALEFDTGSKLILGNMALLRQLIPTTFSVELWVKPGRKSETAHLLSAMGPLADQIPGGWILSSNSSGFDFTIMGYDDEDQGWTSESVSTKLPINSGSWCHLGVVYDGSFISLLVNGQLQEKRAYPYSLIYPKLADFQLGGTIMGGQIMEESISAFQGQLSELRLWDIPLKKSQIKARMKERLTGFEKGLAAYWPLDEGEGDIAYDKLPGKTLTANLSKITREKRTDFPAMLPQYGAVAELHGHDQYLKVEQHKALALENGFTLSIWANAHGATGNPEDYPLLSMRGPSAGWELFMGMAQVGFVMHQQNPKRVSRVKLTTQQGEILLGRWYHIAVVFDKKRASLFVNGVLKSSKLAKNLLSFPTELNIGRSTMKQELGFYGRLAELGIWSKALTETEITNIAFQGPAENEQELIAYWKLDEIHGSTATDISSNEIPAKLVRVIKIADQLPIGGRKVYEKVDDKDKFLKLWQKQDEMADELKKQEKLIESFESKTRALESRYEDQLAEIKRLQEQNKLLASGHSDQIQELKDEHKNKLEELAKTQGAETTLRELIETANEQVVDARKALLESGGAYQLGTVTMEMKVLPGQSGRGVVFPSKEELEKFDQSQLSKLSFELAPQEKAKTEKESNTQLVPNVLGLTELMAKRKLSEQGYKMEVHFQAVEREGDISQDGRVVRQSPKEGSYAAPGIKINVFIGKETGGTTNSLR